MFVNLGHAVVNSVNKVKYYLAYVLWVGLEIVRKPRFHCKQKKSKKKFTLRPCCVPPSSAAAATRMRGRTRGI